jgi:hypothetical protein
MKTTQILRTVVAITSLVALLGFGMSGCGGELVNENDELAEVGELEQTIIETNQMGTCVYPNWWTMTCTYRTEVCYYYRDFWTWKWILDECVPLGGGY